MNMKGYTGLGVHMKQRELCLLSKVLFFKVSACMMCACMGSCMCRCPQNPEEGVRSPRARVLGCSESPDVGSGNQTQTYCKRIKYF